MAPLIGITGRRGVGHTTGQTAPHLAESPTDFYFAEYGQRLRAAAALPVEVPITEDPGGYAQRLDGLVLSGGGDVDPGRYGGSAHRGLGVSSHRDDFEIELFRAALEADIPILAICRGIQLVNVALGGTLIGHLAHDEGDEHSRGRDDRAAAVHDIEISEGSILHGLYGPTTRVNSFHHQAINRPGDGLTITARSPDGTVEGAELDGGRVLCVQWHPEMMAPLAPVFGWLVGVASN
ncbi:MAG: gamma-glutamyl-gamma-aminobutyrate hydrolase family protein [Actinomycetia bacterium]|nr:gamma-glutamyl-gamma-aminobutyrate hydrolase family protein [Actinomycetes bacterium]